MVTARFYKGKKGLPRFQHKGLGFFLILGICSLFPFSADSAVSFLPEAEEYIENGSYAVQTTPKTFHGFNVDIPYIPASIIKIVTSLMVLERFGPDHRFTTPVYLDDQHNLYIQGSGDPFLTSEAVRSMARQLRTSEMRSLRSLILDNSAFTLESPPPGTRRTDNPYDAGNGALVVNFNTVSFAIDHTGGVSSGEQQTPMLPLMKDLARTYPPGRYRVNVGTLAPEQEEANAIRYSGELFLAIFAEEGITFTKGYSLSKVPAKAQLLYNFRSPITLAEMVRRFLLYSNNYVANQLFLLAGSQQRGAPATWEKAKMAAEQYLAGKLQLSPDQAIMVDGSGLSIWNRISAEAMLAVLHRFLPYHELLPQESGIYLKSGTLTRAYSYAGYFDTPQGLAPFVLMLNQQANNRDKVLQLLHKKINNLSSRH